MMNTQTFQVALIHSENPMIAEQIENGEIGDGTLTVDVETGRGEFVSNDTRIIISDCGVICIENDAYVDLHNEEGQWSFEVLESEAS